MSGDLHNRKKKELVVLIIEGEKLTEDTILFFGIWLGIILSLSYVFVGV